MGFVPSTHWVIEVVPELRDMDWVQGYGYAPCVGLGPSSEGHSPFQGSADTVVEVHSGRPWKDEDPFD